MSVGPPKSSTMPRSVAFLVCFSNRRNWRRLLLPALLVPKNPVTLPRVKSASRQALKFSSFTRFNIFVAPTEHCKCLGTSPTHRGDSVHLGGKLNISVELKRPLGR